MGQDRPVGLVGRNGPRVTTDRLLPNVLANRAAQMPDRIFVREVGGADESYAGLLARSRRWSRAFQDIGIDAGDHVVTMTLPSISWLSAWVGLAAMGAVDTGVSVDLRGALLQGALRRSDARAVVVSSEFSTHLTPEVLAETLVEHVVVVDGRALGPSVPGVTVHHGDEFLAVPAWVPAAPVEPWDTSCIVMTSGTTGQSKFVVIPWGHACQGALGLFAPGELSDDDVLYAPLPVSHVAARFLVHRFAIEGGTVVLRPGVSIAAFWDDVRRFSCTVGLTFGIAGLLYEQPPSDRDRDHTLRWSLQGPAIAQHADFTERFGVKVRTGFGSSEVGIPLATRGGTVVDSRSSGRIVTNDDTHFEIRLVDDHDCEVPLGEAGELIVRTDEPWQLMTEYYGMPEETARAWRNGWLHTGDRMRTDESGEYYFVDRLKDVIRRRGENVSPPEVEKLVRGHERVRDCATVGHAGSNGDDQVRIFAVPTDSSLTAAELLADLNALLPRFMRPDIVELVPELPTSGPMSRVDKKVLRALPISADAAFR